MFGLSADDAARLRRVEQKLDAILRHLGLPGAGVAGLPADVIEAIEQGQTIEAIRRYRQATGASLVEAKAAVEGHVVRD